MNSAWSFEFTRLIALIISAILFGLVSGHWIISVTIHTLIYIVWISFQLRTFEQWIKKGAQNHSAPDNSGIWQLLTQHIYRSQKATKDRKNQLRKLAAHYHAVMSALPDATIVLNNKREIEWANKRAEKLIGLNLVLDIGQPLENIFRELALQKLFESTEKTSSVDIQSPVHTNITLTLTRTSFGEEKTLIIARDISQRIALQHLRKAFIANASHELRTPLTVIAGYLEILNEDDELSEAAKNCVKGAIQQSDRMEKILKDLLLLSKLEENDYLNKSYEPINVSHFLQQIVSDFKVTEMGANHQYELNCNEDLLLKISEKNLYSLVQNLLTNATKYSPKNTLIRVYWSLNSEGYACLSVCDEGEGIAEEFIERITQRFYRVNKNRTTKVSGTGLGLSIVKHIIDNHEGYLDIQSEISKGSNFTACFPSKFYSVNEYTKLNF